MKCEEKKLQKTSPVSRGRWLAGGETEGATFAPHSMAVLLSIIIFYCLCFHSVSVFAAMPDFEEKQGIYAVDVLNGHVFCQQNEDQQAPPASMTKLMTALVAMDYLSEQLDATVTIGTEATQIAADSSSAKLGVGDTYTWMQILNGMFLPSGNDAAMVVALHCAQIAKGTELSVDDGIAAFSDMMNAKAESLGLSKTHFTNPHGLPDDALYTTPKEMAVIAQAALSNPTIKAIVSTVEYECTSGKGKEHKWKNTNLLIHPTGASFPEDYADLANSNENPFYREKVIGGKTGSTDEAGKCIAFEGDDGDIQFVIVVMNAPKYEVLYQQAAIIIDEINQYTHTQWTEEAKCYDWKIPFLASITDGLLIEANTDGVAYSTVLKSRKEHICSEVEWKSDYFVITGPFARVIKGYSAGDVIAEIAVYDGDQCVDRVPLYASSDMSPIGIGEIIILIVLNLIFIILLLIRKTQFAKSKKKTHGERTRGKATGQ